MIFATAALVVLRGRLDKAHVVMVYLLVVLAGSALGGRATGLLLAVVAFFAFNFFLLPPYHTLALADPRDWLILAAFLVSSVIATGLLARAQRAAALARERAREVDRLARLGAESLAAGRAEEAVGAIARALQRTLGIRSCEIHMRDPEAGTLTRVAGAGEREPRPGAPPGAPGSPADASDETLLQVVARQGESAARHVDGTMRVIARKAPAEALAEPGAGEIALPLRVRDRIVGVLRLAHGREIRLDESQRRFAEALLHYAALAVERVRLVAEAERAEALREADRLKDALIASVSHDLRTPLTTIKALAYELRSTGSPSAVLIEEEADRLNRFVSDLLDLSRLRAGALPLQPELVAADDLLGAALQHVAGVPNAGAIRASLPEGEEILVGRFDFVHALRALVNLLDNALKHAPPGLPVEVEVARRGDRLALAVRDQGPGVAAEDRDRIFEPFVRGGGDAAESRGAGLGLAIARQLARAQGGDVEYHTRDGGGSEFILLLPAAQLSETWTAEPV
jgi:two-component system sensor histidine kinase KdpD